MNLTDRRRQADWLRELQTALVCTLVLAGAGAATNSALACVGPLTVEVPVDPVVDAAAATLRTGAELAEHGSVDVTIADPGPTQALLGVLSQVPTALVVLTMLALLLRIVRAARRTDPFTAGTVRGMRRVAAVVIAGGWLAWGVEAVARFALAGTVTDAGTTVTLLAPLLWLATGLGFLAAAEVVNRGRAMRTELAEVI